MSTTTEAFLAGTAITSIFTAIFLLYLLPVIADWKIFTKAGIPGWKSLIPVYNLYLLYKISGMSGLWVLPLFVAAVCSAFVKDYSNTSDILVIVTLVSYLIAVVGEIIKAVKLPKAFGKGIGYTILLILLPNMGEIALGFGSAEYQGDYRK